MEDWISLSEDWDIENIGDEEEPELKFSWKDEKAKKEMLEFIGFVGGLSKEEVEQICKEEEKKRRTDSVE